MELTFLLVSIMGTAVFAASGALVAAEQKFDAIGAMFLSVASGVGAGTVIDLLTGSRVRWLDSPEPLWAALVTSILVFEAARFVRPPEKSLIWADAVGLSIFSSTGMQQLMDFNFDFAVTLFLAAIGASGGGIIRDVLANRPPLVFSGEIYVTVALSGSISHYLCAASGVPPMVALITGAAITFLVRATGIIFKLRLFPGNVAKD